MKTLPGFVAQVDPNRGKCLDKETGLLVNHAYGLADMKVKYFCLGCTISDLATLCGNRSIHTGASYCDH